MTAPGRGTRGQAVPSAFRGAALVFVAVVVGIIGLQILDDSGGGGSSASSGAEPTTTAVGDQPAPHKASDVTIKVYNASGVQSAGQTLTDKLEGYGYTMLEPATLNATRKGTVVECRSGFDPDGVVIAAYGIGNGALAEPFPSSPPAESEDADCIVILGTA